MQGNLEISGGGDVTQTELDAVADAQFIVAAADADLTAERVATDTTSITWDFTTAAQAKAKRAALTGDVTAAADTNTTTIANDAVSNSKLADMAQATFKMRAAAAGTGDPIDGTAAQAKTALAIDHGADVTGLGDDDHTQYALLAGRSGGQTLQGGTASGDDLVLESTAHATKGTIFLGSSESGATRVVVNGAGDSITVGGATLASRLIIHDETAGEVESLGVHKHSDTAASGANHFFARTRGTSGTPTVVSSGDRIAQISFVGYDGTDFEQAAVIHAEVDGTPGAGDMPGRLIFLTTPDGSAAPAEAMRIASTKNVSLQALLDLSAAGAGQIQFPATQNASSNANTLDDYEEGTWTPVIGGAGGTSGQTYSAQVGRYVKHGKMVICQFRAILTAKGTITGSVVITGLPFTTENVANLFSTSTLLWENLATNWVNLICLGSNNNTQIQIVGAAAAAASNGTAPTTTDINNNTQLSGGVFYRAES